MNQIIKEIQKQIELYRQKEDEYRIRRETLEGMLNKVTKDEAEVFSSEKASVENFKYINAKTTPIKQTEIAKEKVSSNDLAEIAFRLMSNMEEWKFIDIWKNINDYLNLEVPRSTLREAFKKDYRFEKVDRGIYRIKDTDTAKERPETSPEI